MTIEEKNKAPQINRLRFVVEAAGCGHDKIAKDLGISEDDLDGYMHGTATPPLGLMISMADYFNVSMDYITGRTTERSEDPFAWDHIGDMKLRTIQLQKQLDELNTLIDARSAVLDRINQEIDKIEREINKKGSLKELASSTPIESLNLSVRSYNILKHAGANTIQDIIFRITDETFFNLRNFGEKNQKEVLDILMVMGYVKKQDNGTYSPDF